MLGGTYYPEGQIAPEFFREGFWDVWDKTGTLQVLQKREYPAFLSANPRSHYMVNCANNAVVRIQVGDELWQELVEITKEFRVEVLPPRLGADYVQWTGSSDSETCFDVIRIWLKEPVASE